MLVNLDDYFIHQNAESIVTVAHGRSNWQERTYFNMLSPDAETLIVCGFGMAPNENMVMGYAISSVPEVGQRNYRALKPLDGARDKLEVGALRFDVVQPFQRWNLSLGSNESGIEFDLEWTARHQHWEFGKIHTMGENDEVSADFMHLQQSGTYRGKARVGDRVFDLDGWYGQRDRTWGIRTNVQFWIWCHVQFEDSSLSIYHFESSKGEILYSNAGLCHADHVSAPMQLIDHDLDLRDGERVADHGRFRLRGADGSIHEVEFEFLGPLVSYWAPPRTPDDKGTWVISNPEDTGRWETKASSSFDIWDYAQNWGGFLGSPVYDALCRFRMNGKTGYGVFEIMSNRYAPYGFESTS